jgi:hypothetical protein
LAGTAVLARIRRKTFIDLNFAARARVARQARAKIRLNAIATSTAIGARIQRAVIDVSLAVCARVTRKAIEEANRPAVRSENKKRKGKNKYYEKERHNKKRETNQLQMYPLILSRQVPPFWQILGTHSLILVSQRGPE